MGDFAAIEEFERLVAAVSARPADRPPPPGELAGLALGVSSVLRGGLDWSPTLVRLTLLADRCEQPTRRAVVDGLVGSGTLRGDRAAYGNWRSSCIDHVIATGRGIPITLSIVVVEVGRQLGVPLHGVGMPAHFLVGDDRDDDWFLDPFNGREFDRDGCHALLADLSGGGIAWNDAFLAPTESIDVVARVLNNLGAVFSRRRDPLRLALVTRMRLALPGAPTEVSTARRALAPFN